jgi:hypothetical protein
MKALLLCAALFFENAVGRQGFFELAHNSSIRPPGNATLEPPWFSETKALFVADGIRTCNNSQPIITSDRHLTVLVAPYTRQASLNTGTSPISPCPPSSPHAFTQCLSFLTVLHDGPGALFSILSDDSYGEQVRRSIAAPPPPPTTLIGNLPQSLLGCHSGRRRNWRNIHPHFTTPYAR